MQPLRRVAESKEQRAAAELGRAQQHLQTQLARLQEIQNYQQEYLSRFEQAGMNGIAADKLLSFRNFLEKLDTAVEQQQQAVNTANDVVDQRKRQWFSSRDKVKIFNKVISNFVDQEFSQEQKQEQKETDEKAQRSS